MTVSSTANPTLLDRAPRRRAHVRRRQEHPSQLLAVGAVAAEGLDVRH